MGLNVEFGARTVTDFISMLRGRQINLAPGFQRQSVWSRGDRMRLIESIFGGYPVPSIFLYKRQLPNGRLVYDVIDGKQRLETLFMFAGVGPFKGDVFETRLDLGGDGRQAWTWSDIKRRQRQDRPRFEGYKLQTVEVSGELSEIVDLFVRINSTGRHLTSGEKRHAKFYESPFLKEAARLVHRYRPYLLSEGVLSKGQLSRMKGDELFAELLMSIHEEGPINKKTSLDKAIGNDSVNRNTLGRLSRAFVRTMGRMKRMYPGLRSLRMHNSAEFYSLFLLTWQMDRDGLVSFPAGRTPWN